MRNKKQIIAAIGSGVAAIALGISFAIGAAGGGLAVNWNSKVPMGVNWNSKVQEQPSLGVNWNSKVQEEPSLALISTGCKPTKGGSLDYRVC